MSDEILTNRDGYEAVLTLNKGNLLLALEYRIKSLGSNNPLINTLLTSRTESKSMTVVHAETRMIFSL